MTDHTHESDSNTDVHEHNHANEYNQSLQAAVLTVSSTRTFETDESGEKIVELFESNGHSVAVRELTSDDFDQVQNIVHRFVQRNDVDIVITTGGTGVSPDDITVEAILPMFDKQLPGFGELFRQLSRDEIGTRIISTRSTAGIINGVPVFCLPGSTSAVDLGVSEIILQEANHLVTLAQLEGESTDT
ncbi:MAG: molybdenum cofactor biosynthesis protein B [Halobacteriaceae archaeon]